MTAFPVSVLLDPDAVTYGTIGLQDPLTLVLKPDQVQHKSVIWDSSNKAVATVDQTGVVTTLSNGSTTITATTADGLVATCVVGVLAAEVNPASVTFTTLGVQAEAFEFLVNGEPDDQVTWTSSNTGVATVNPYLGTLTTKHDGTTTVTGTSTEDETLVGTSAVTVDLPITSVTITPPPANKAASSHLQLEATYLPIEAEASITWSLKEGSDTRVATVSASGDVTAGTRAGTVDVTATAKLTESEVAINVNPVQPAPINFDTGGHVPLELGDVLTVTTNMPAGATSLTWTYPTEKFTGETGSAANEYLLTLIHSTAEGTIPESSFSVVAIAEHGGLSPERTGTDGSFVDVVPNPCETGDLIDGLCWSEAQLIANPSNANCPPGFTIPSQSAFTSIVAHALPSGTYWLISTEVTGTAPAGGCQRITRSGMILPGRITSPFIVQDYTNVPAFYGVWSSPVLTSCVSANYGGAAATGNCSQGAFNSFYAGEYVSPCIHAGQHVGYYTQQCNGGGGESCASIIGTTMNILKCVKPYI
jgi:hypothetical protein